LGPIPRAGLKRRFGQFAEIAGSETTTVALCVSVGLSVEILGPVDVKARNSH
jgi:hypothetical protein